MRVQNWFGLTKTVQVNTFGNATQTDFGASAVTWQVQERFSPRELAQFHHNNDFVKLFFFPHNSTDTQ